MVSLAYADSNPTLKEIFCDEYLLPLNTECHLKASETVVAALVQLKSKYNVNTIADVGCGDSDWLDKIIPHFNYVGIDIVDAIVEKNRTNYSNSSALFLSSDITREQLSPFDLILCRNCLNYYSFCDLYLILNGFKSSESTYLLVSTTPSLPNNQENRTGVKRAINLQAPPFSFPNPLMVISEDTLDGTCLALWHLNDIDLSVLYCFAYPPLTVLSKPIGKQLFWEHPAVAASARRGLLAFHPNYNFNPDVVSDVKENVVVISDLEAGRQAYQLKQNMLIKTLVVGPNVVGTPKEGDFFITRPLIDVIVSPSEWPGKSFEDFTNNLKGRTKVWFAGVDEKYWKPSVSYRDKKSNSVLLYRKTNVKVCNQAQDCLERHGYHVVPITYGNYTLEQYKTALEGCKFAVFVSISESQGIALAEAWSMDVPTLVWNPQEPIIYREHLFQEVSSCPYLNSMVGKEWVTIDELKSLLCQWNEYSAEFQARRWVLMNMTDKVSIEQLLSVIREVKIW